MICSLVTVSLDTAAKFPREKSLLSVGLFLRFCAKILSTNIFNADAMRAARNRQMEMSLQWYDM